MLPKDVVERLDRERLQGRISFQGQQTERLQPVSIDPCQVASGVVLGFPLWLPRHFGTFPCEGRAGTLASYPGARPAKTGLFSESAGLSGLNGRPSEGAGQPG